MKSNLLFLDDIRNPTDCLLYMQSNIQDIEIYRKEWQIVRSYNEFVAWIETHGLPDFISFHLTTIWVYQKILILRNKTE
jgi:hypothetical protein